MIPSNPNGRAELWEQLSRAIDLRASQDQVLWSIFGFFGATNAILLAALFANGEFPKDPWVNSVVIVAGLLLSYLWQKIQKRALGHIEHHEALMEIIERTLEVPQEFAVSVKINCSPYARDLGKGIPAREIMERCGWGSAILWAAIAAICLGKSCGIL